MLFYLSKIVYIVLMPIAWIIGLSLFSVFTKNERRRKRFIITSLVLLLITSNPFLSNHAFKAFEYPLNNIDKLDKRELGIILSGVTQNINHIDGRTFLKRGGDRVTHAVYLYNRGIIKHILVTGGSGSISKEKETPEAIRIKSLLLEMGIPEKHITTETNARNTHENAINSKLIIDKKFPKSKPILITSAFHMARSKACFNKLGIEVTPVACNVMSKQSDCGIVDFLPKESAMAQWELLIHESIGRLVYKILGYS